MKTTILVTASAAVLALAGCSKTQEPASETANNTTATTAPAEDMAAAPAAAPASAGQAFADTAASSDMFEIESSRLAAANASSAKVKTFAEQMIKAHTDSTAKLKSVAGSASPAITPVPKLTAMQQQTLNDLKGKTGAAFDTAYSKAQAYGHQMTLDALKTYSANGDVPSLKAFATEMVPIVTAHLNMAKAL